MTCSCRSRGCVRADIRGLIIFRCHEDAENQRSEITGQGSEVKGQSAQLERANIQPATSNPDEQNRDFGSIQKNPKSQIANPKKIAKSNSQSWSPALFSHRRPESCSSESSRQRFAGSAQGE